MSPTDPPGQNNGWLPLRPRCAIISGYPEATMPFLTDLAPAARIKGSRDPLGLLPIWSRVGRKAIQNVTTVSGDLRGWTTLIIALGLYNEGVAAGHWTGDTDEPFFRAEQLIGFSRVTHGSGTEVRGRNRLRYRLAEYDNGKRRIPLGTTSRARRVLNNQAAAGVWGQIASAGAASGLVDRKRRALMPAAEILWTSTYRPALAPHMRLLRRILSDQTGFAPNGEHSTLAKVLADHHKPRLRKKEVTVYQDQILYAGRGEDGDQAQLVKLWLQRGADQPVDLLGVEQLRQAAKKSGAANLSESLDTIRRVEQLLGPCERLFGYLLTRGKKSTADVVAEVSSVWTAPIPGAAECVDALLEGPLIAAYGKRAMSIQAPLHATRQALVTGAWAEAIRQVIHINRAVMRFRGADAWIQVVEGDLDVRLAGESSELPKPARLGRELVHSYYLDPFRRLIDAWESGHG